MARGPGLVGRLAQPEQRGCPGQGGSAERTSSRELGGWTERGQDGSGERHLSGPPASEHLSASRDICPRRPRVWTTVRRVSRRDICPARFASGHLSAALCLGTFVRRSTSADICPSRNAGRHLSAAGHLSDRFLARTFVRTVSRPDICPRRFASGHLSGAVLRSDICPVRGRRRTFVGSRLAGADICPRPVRLVASSGYCTSYASPSVTHGYGVAAEPPWFEGLGPPCHNPGPLRNACPVAPRAGSSRRDSGLSFNGRRTDEVEVRGRGKRSWEEGFELAGGAGPPVTAGRTSTL
jgi:hypothetical protein